MKKLADSLVAIAVITGTIFAGDHFTKNLNIDSESSESFTRSLADKTNVTVQIAGGDLGSGRIISEVYDPSGKKVGSGQRLITFNTKNVNGSYKIVVINKTKNHQQIAVSVNSTKVKGEQ